MKFSTAIIILLLSVIALAAEFALYLFMGIGAALSGGGNAVGGIAFFFVGLMILTAVAGFSAPICALVEMGVKKKNAGVYTFLSLLGITSIIIIGSGIAGLNKTPTTVASSANNASTPKAVVPSSTPAVGTTSTQAEEPKGNPEEEAYLGKISVKDITVGKSILDEEGVFGEIKNTGNRTLKEVEITVYALGKDGKPVWDDKFYPVLDSKFAFGDSAEPLKPNYGRKFGYKVEAPSDWNKKVRVEVTKVEFAEPK